MLNISATVDNELTARDFGFREVFDSNSSFGLIVLSQFPLYMFMYPHFDNGSSLDSSPSGHSSSNRQTVIPYFIMVRCKNSCKAVRG